MFHISQQPTRKREATPNLLKGATVPGDWYPGSEDTGESRVKLSGSYSPPQTGETEGSESARGQEIELQETFGGIRLLGQTQTLTKEGLKLNQGASPALFSSNSNWGLPLGKPRSHGHGGPGEEACREYLDVKAGCDNIEEQA